MNWLSIATLGPIGYLPAPGTCASIATIALVYSLSYTTIIFYITLLAIIFVLGFKASDYAAHILQHPDPSCVVIDECIGTLITFIALPINMPIVIVGILLFRFFDISKWCGVHWFQQLPSAWGVIMDDVVAGIFSSMLLHLLHFRGFL